MNRNIFRFVFSPPSRGCLTGMKRPILNRDPTGPEIDAGFMSLQLCAQPIPWNPRVRVSGGEPDSRWIHLIPLVKQGRTAEPASDADVVRGARPHHTLYEASLAPMSTGPPSNDVRAVVVTVVKNNRRLEV